MDAIKQYMKPKWWLTGVGAIFTIFMLLTYAEIMNAAETGWGPDYTANDAFYEKAWAATYLIIAIISIVSGQFVEGRPQAILAMTIGAGNILNFILVLIAAGDLEYGFTDDPANWAPPMVMATGLLVSGFLHLEDD
ncbi:MAG: hypothetical protein CMB03_02975 [Euryarchaeota archaeon]|nr:hypothetical protein [Euryarchaeota archaeon]|tara:strand:- start:838 stop:1245 length:408 start_codon:yes stop_codon:yes gene_type:complete